MRLLDPPRWDLAVAMADKVVETIIANGKKGTCVVVALTPPPEAKLPYKPRWWGSAGLRGTLVIAFFFMLEDLFYELRRLERVESGALTPRGTLPKGERKQSGAGKGK